MKNNKEQMELLVYEMISFLLKWGLWKDTIIFSNGKKYAHTYKAEEKYKGLPYVEFKENINPDDYKMCLSDSEHIFDMVFNGPLYDLLNNNVYEVEMADITEEALNYILEHTDIIECYMSDEYECYDVYEFLELNMERQFVNTEYITWNPLVFDTWEEYKELISGKEYAVYFENVEAPEMLSTEKLFLPIWEQMMEDSKREVIRKCRCNDIRFSSFELTQHVHSEFRNILDRYGLWYLHEFGCCSLSCF